ncbi:hypothetical protein J6590_095980, partial [Homalodisca vitripennis]
RKQRPADLYHPSPAKDQLAAQARARPLMESPHRVIPETETVLADLYHPSPATEELAAQARARLLVESPHRVMYIVPGYHPEK